MKHFIYSKTFWAATIAVGVEVLSAVQALPFLTDSWAHGIAVASAVFIALNRAFKNYQ